MALELGSVLTPYPTPKLHLTPWLGERLNLNSCQICGYSE